LARGGEEFQDGPVFWLGGKNQDPQGDIKKKKTWTMDCRLKMCVGGGGKKGKGVGGFIVVFKKGKG